MKDKIIKIVIGLLVLCAVMFAECRFIMSNLTIRRIDKSYNIAIGVLGFEDEYDISSLFI